MNSRWDKKEKEKLISMYAEGNPFDVIAEKLGRSETAVRLRLHSIIYDGIANGMKIDELQKITNIAADNIIQMFYTHRDFKQSRGETVVPIEDLSKLLSIKSKSNTNNSESTNKKKLVDDLVAFTTKPEKKRNIRRSESSAIISNDDIDKLIEQNKIMEAIINNRELRKRIKTLYRRDKLNDNEKKILKKILS